ncbi:MAG: UDP-N-acetylglucosamine--N-acetylmuramyl-(pentapeptide) pyrophosphoryl-undecaprenol N-acetylglucosamine transferase [Candidatus Vogelbacteria bacterium]|nr:UDP-N-acetylglucosamine--N-acetylmuramyl-(pentapeptide) pyrophosphoryl-undecaprenol N-acetylglucosamine transferase [Candidatus Vogelbacteria bacterium]
MKIVLTGGGTGGHFYPLIAVSQALYRLADQQKLVDVAIWYLAPEPYNPRALFEEHITFIPISAGKMRRYFSIHNFIDVFKTLFGMIQALWQLFFIFPDVVLSKGGYASVPTVWAARILGIPIVIHESDSKPGRANLWAGRFATKIAVSYAEAASYFPAGKVAITGNPIRAEIINPITNGAHEYLKLEPNLPIILVIGGSQGATRINDAFLDLAPELIKSYQIIHQVGKTNLSEVNKRISYLLADSPDRERYRVFDYLNETALRMTAGVTDLVVSRSGSAVFEFAVWGVPAILVPIPESISHDQRSNAFMYARTGAAAVIEENNLTKSVLSSEINRIISNRELRAKMSEAAKAFAKPEAAATIAQALIDLAATHE